VPTTITLKSRIVAVAVALMALLMGSVASDRADAMTPAQTTESGVVNLLGGWTAYTGTIEDFWARTLPAWGYSYSKPGIQYYGNGAGGYYDTACGATSPWSGENGFYCSTANTIYLDYWGQQGLLNRLGDHGSGGFLAHEWAHRAQARMGTLVSNFRSEYNADCMAGLYTRFGYNTGRLAGSDYGEFWNWLYYQRSSVSHGTGPNRAAWFQYGYNQYSKSACDTTFALTASGASLQRTATSKLAAARRLSPPARAAADLTPRHSRALPRGNDNHITFPRSQQRDRHEPVS
jgi:predicted metalloprotease